MHEYFVYAQPLHEYSGPEFCKPSALPEAARWWATHIHVSRNSLILDAIAPSYQAFPGVVVWGRVTSLACAT